MTPTEEVQLEPKPNSSAGRILTTALELFAVRGYDATSVREICEAAGITKPTLYHFFGSKEGVLLALVKAGFERFRDMVDVSMAQPGTLRARLQVLTRAMFTSAREQPKFWRFMHSIVWAPPGTAPAIDCDEFYDGVVGVIAAATDEASERGEVKKGNTEVRMLVLMGSVTEAATGFVISGKPELTDELADQIVDTILGGWN